MDFFNGSEMQLVSEVVGSHDSMGRLLSSAFYTLYDGVLMSVSEIQQAPHAGFFKQALGY